ncbi:MAG TPA: electron transfer flavoprotein subunit beta/FixA family protein [Bacillota bacterium]
MHAVVCLKQVPDTTEVKIDPSTGTLVRAGVPSIVNPYDAHALEAALRLKDQFGGKVTVVSMGPPQASQALKKAVSLGADEAILLTDRVFAGSDTLATSYILTQALLKLAEKDPIDVVFCGKMAIDGDTGQVGPGIATRLDYEQLTYVSDIGKLDAEKREITVWRALGDGKEQVKTRLPALLTVTDEVNDVRYGSFPDQVRAARYEPITWTKDDLHLDLARCGLKGSPTTVSKVFTPQARVKRQTDLIPDGLEKPGEAAEAMAAKLFGLPPVKKGIAEGRALAKEVAGR